MPFATVKIAFGHLAFAGHGRKVLRQAHALFDEALSLRDGACPRVRRGALIHSGAPNTTSSCARAACLTWRKNSGDSEQSRRQFGASLAQYRQLQTLFLTAPQLRSADAARYLNLHAVHRRQLLKP